MAEERRDGRPGGEERPAGAQQSAVPPAVKKKKKRGKGRLLFALLLLSLGVGTGLHFSGLWDARPLFWGIVPHVPYVGPSLANFFEIPERYALTVAERRALELEEWQKRLDERERELGTRESAVDAASGDIGTRAERLAQQEASQQQSDSQGPDESADAERKLIDQVVRTYQDMSARNAAQIVEQVREPLAVELLQKLPVDARASILGKMDPKKAARLTELMATSQ